MDNFALRSAMVTQQSSKTSLRSGINFKELMSELGKNVSDYLTSINIDKRNVAVASLNTFWVYELVRDMEPEWLAIIECEHIAQEQILFTHKPNSVLFMSADMVMIPIYKAKFPNSTICMMNNCYLFYAESIIDWQNQDDYEYDVIDREDLGVEKFDMIIAWAWSIVGSDSILLDMVSSLNSGGALLIDCSNHNTKLYREDFHIHPYSRMHDLLKEQDGHTYHLANGYGQTVFIKN